MREARPTTGRSLAERYGAVAFDLDGVVYHGHEAVAAAPPTLARVRELAVRLLFLTNNSARTPQRVAAKLTDLGVQAGPEDVLTSAQATGATLARDGARGASAFVIGERGIKEALEAAGIHVIAGEPDMADLVVVGWDRQLDYEKLRRATILVGRGARLVATNGDASYPGPDGAWPGAGAILAAVTTATGAKPTVVGKPERPMFDAAASRLQAEFPPGPLMVGDRLDTDISGASSAGWHSLLVCTGVSGPADLLGAQDLPTYMGSDISAVLHDLVPAIFRLARSDDADEVGKLLASAGLDSGETRDRLDATVVCEGPAGELAATACVELRDDIGMLRSVAVAEAVRGQGLGTLAAAAAVHARLPKGVRAVALFAEAASPFFERLGFVPVDRSALPRVVQETDQAVACGESAIAMIRQLNP